MKNKVYIETFGCSLNFSDTEFMKGRLEEDGYQLVDDENQAEIIILNTCTVKNRTYLNFLKRLKELNGRLIVIAGCIPPVYKDGYLLKDFSFIGPDNLTEISEVVEKTIKGEKVQIISGKLFKRLGHQKVRRNPVIEIVPISRGCLGDCAYCQIKLARGELLSYPIREIAHQIETALSEGVKEVWLTAQDCGIYGEDIGSSLPELLKNVFKIKGDFKLRLGMANPDGVLKYLNELKEIYAEPRIFKFLHIPVQSGSDNVLKAMRRKYSAGDFIKICDTFRESVQRISISTDIIAGFPTETEDDFEMSLNLLKKIKPATINRSRFSPRPFTPAASLKQLHSSVIARRSKMLDELVKEISLQNNKEWLGLTGEVILDERKKEGSVLGRNTSYKPVVFHNNNFHIGETIKAQIIDITTHHLIGSVNPEEY